jgi:N-acetylneuraminate lyase
MVDFLQKAPARIPNLAGIKFTHNNFMEMQQCLQMDDWKWDILHGFDEVLLAGLSFGVKAAVGSTYNFMAPLYNHIIEAFNSGNMSEARKLQAISVEIIKILIRYNGAIVAGKSVMKSIGMDCGHCRTPLRNLSENEYSNLVKELEKAGLYELNGLT